MASTPKAPLSGPTAPVPKDPQPSVDRIDELARRIQSGDILLPKFQREFVWSRGQILTLLDSIVRNYPIGSVLLWQSRQELRSENKIADLEIQLPKPDYPVNYLLDGPHVVGRIIPFDIKGRRRQSVLHSIPDGMALQDRGRERANEAITIGNRLAHSRRFVRPWRKQVVVDTSHRATFTSDDHIHTHFL